MTMDGGLERLVRILHDFCICPSELIRSRVAQVDTLYSGGVVGK
jgi:hypothetical protein